MYAFEARPQSLVSDVDDDVVVHRIVVREVALRVVRAAGFDTVLTLESPITHLSAPNIRDKVVSHHVVMHLLPRLEIRSWHTVLVKGDPGSTGAIDKIVFEEIARTTLDTDRMRITVAEKVFLTAMQAAATMRQLVLPQSNKAHALQHENRRQDRRASLCTVLTRYPRTGCSSL
jgi:hypothetical protein